ncbi:hypothetical protein D3C76_547020 [compost metagenome]
MQVGLDPGFATQAERAAVVVRVRHELHAVAEQGPQRLLRPMAAHQAQRALAHAMVGALEGQHGAAPGGATHQFERRFNGIGAGRAAELHLGFPAQRLGQYAEQVLDKAVLDRRGQVEGVQRQFVGQHLLDRLDYHRVVMAQGQSAGAGQAVDELAAFDILDMDATGALERQWNAPWVAAGVGFLLLLALQQRRIGELVQGLRRTGRQDLGKAGSGRHGRSSQASESAPPRPCKQMCAGSCRLGNA